MSVQETRVVDEFKGYYNVQLLGCSDGLAVGAGRFRCSQSGSL